MIPFSSEVFFAELAHYNLVVWPAQILALALGLAVVGTTLKPLLTSGRFVAAVLGAAWLFCGLVYHLGHLALLNFWDYPIGVLFVLQGCLILWAGLVKGRLSPQQTSHRSAGVAIMAFALIGHPAIALAIGRPLTEIAVFGAAPTPTLLFTFGALLASGPVPALWILPCLLTVPAGVFAFLLPVPEDWSLLPVAAIAVAAALRNGRTSAS